MNKIVLVIFVLTSSCAHKTRNNLLGKNIPFQDSTRVHEDHEGKINFSTIQSWIRSKKIHIGFNSCKKSFGSYISFSEMSPSEITMSRMFLVKHGVRLRSFSSELNEVFNEQKLEGNFLKLTITTERCFGKDGRFALVESYEVY